MVGLSASELPEERLFPGDTIEYFSMTFVAGDPRGHRVAKILRVNHKNDEFPIEVDTQEMLPLTIMLKRKRDRIDTDISSDDAKWRKLRTFRLEDGEVEGETRSDRLNAGLHKSLSDAMKSTKRKVAMKQQEESNNRSKKLMQVFLTQPNVTLDEDKTTSSQQGVVDTILTPKRKKKGKTWTQKGNADDYSDVRPHDKFVLKKNYYSDNASRRNRFEDKTAQSEQKVKYDAKKLDLRKRKRVFATPAKPKRVDTTRSTKRVSKYFSGKQEQHRPRKRHNTDLSKFMNHVQEADDIEEIEEQKRIVWGLDEYYALDNKRKALEAEDTKSQECSRESSSTLAVESEKTAWSQRRKDYRKMNRESDALRSWLNTLGNAKDIEKKVSTGIHSEPSNKC
ncbi:unnamed protein product [Peronospora farinosa]|uniref:Uncharacterized protein n=1 Tax=Peronospora farinosa TaxID=134698 RepID=A0AAV0TR97_9STRA|nr:unnamed protein product [Peronospora farinosa]CAI5724946.1 unnamed protein product [Peronospora farinosa]